MKGHLMNIVALVGNLASDPELHQTSGGKAVCTFRLAVTRVGNEQADFFTVVAWERQAEICKEYLTLGRRVAVEGRLHYSTWDAPVSEGDKGGRRSKVEVVAHRVELLGARPRPIDETVEGSDDLFAATSDASESVPELVVT